MVLVIAVVSEGFFVFFVVVFFKLLVPVACDF